jgi:type II secretory pathway pseudopilin PulG
MDHGEEGFMLVGLIVAIFLVLLALSVAAPKVAQDLRREREVEAVHRGNQYVRAIRLYYRKTHTYPGSIEQLEKTNNIRFLRQQYVDPMTGKADWKLIHVGEAKTTVKGFFGQPLAGLPNGLGSAAGMASPGIGQSNSGGTGSSSSSSGSSYGFSSSGSGGLGGSSTPTLGGSANAGTNGPTSGGSTSSSGTSGTSGQGSNSTIGAAASQSSSGMPSGGAPFVGVGVPKDGDSITVLNEQTTYDTWEFIYDPRIEQLYAKGALFGGSSSLGSASGSSGFGNTPGSGSAPGLGTTPGFGTTPTPPTAPTTTPQPPQ